MVPNKEATELELIEQTLEAYWEEKSERLSSKKKMREMEGRVRSGGRGEGRKRRRLVEALVCEEDDCLYLEDYMIPVC
jgi:hypothetical protein